MFSLDVDALRSEVARLIQARGLLREDAARELGLHRTALFRFLEKESVPRKLHLIEAVVDRWRAEERNVLATMVREEPGLFMTDHRCPSCGQGTLGPSVAKHCIHCGARFADFACVGCGGLVEKDARFCPSCGLGRRAKKKR